MSFILLLHKQYSTNACSIIKQFMLNKNINHRLLKSIYFIINIKETLIMCRLNFIFNNIMFIIEQLKMTNSLLSVLTVHFTLI